MTQVSDVKTVLTSGLTHIDALLDSGPGWNYLTPATNTIAYTFSIASGNEAGQTGQQAFNDAQKNATLGALNYVSNLTGITFSETSNGSAASLHFGMIDISGASTSGLSSWKTSYAFNGNNTITSYSANTYIYLDNVEWLADNSNLTPGGNGYETLLHEIGHSLGLKHPFEGSPQLSSNQDNTANTLMSYTRSGGPYTTFSPYDVAALNWIYGGDGLVGALGVGSNGDGRYWTGTSSADSITAGSSNDLLKGEAGNDTLTGGSGNDTIFGGDGNDDIAVFSGTFAGYTYSYNASNDTFSLTSAATGTDSVSGVETFQFSDVTKSAGQLQTNDTTAPTLTNLSPADNATGVAASANLVLTFSETVKAGAGDFIIFNVNGTIAKTIAVTDASQVSISGSSVTINPSADLAAGSSYYINIANGALKDSAGNSFAGISGTTAYNFTTEQTTVTPTPTTNTTKAKIFLSTNDGFIVSNSGATVFGSLGTEATNLDAGISGVAIDQNIERAVLTGNSSSYNFLQTGNKLNVYDTASTLLISIPLQGDADGSQLKFSNGVFDAKLGSGIMSLGGAIVSTTTAAALTPSTPSATAEPTLNTLSAAKVFLGAIDAFLASSSGNSIFGNTGEEIATLGAGVNNITLDQNIEKLILGGTSSSYTFKQTGNKINVYDAAGTTPIAAVPVQGDTDGTLITFSDGTASAKLTAGIMSLGLATIGTTTASANPFSSNSTNATSGDIAGTYAYINGAATDSIYLSSEQAVPVSLTGLPANQNAALYSPFNLS